MKDRHKINQGGNLQLRLADGSHVNYSLFVAVDIWDWPIGKKASLKEIGPTHSLFLLQKKLV